jgi:hypothetical protein
LKRQIGVSMDAQVWNAYREVCRREKLRPFEPIEEYLKLVLRNNSALTVLTMIQSMARVEPAAFEAYARVLLNWYKTGRFWIHVTDEIEAPVEHMLLHSLKDVADPRLRNEIQEALVISSHKRLGSKNREKLAVNHTAAQQEPPIECAVSATSERIKEIKKQITGRAMNPEKARKMLEKIHEIREKLKNPEKDQHRKRRQKSSFKTN